MSFKELNLIEPLLKSVLEQGYENPSAIQEKVIPVILEGKDVMAAAQTGTGKTAGFTLPMLQNLSSGERANSNSARALILTPTRELAQQVADSVASYAKYLPLSSFVTFGGVKIGPQMMRLRRGVDILIATPGRLLDLVEKNAIKLNKIEILVLDEADRMLDMGFLPDIKKVLNKLPPVRQNLLFSATFSKEIRALCQKLLNEPVSIATHTENSTADKVKQSVYTVDKKRKSALLKHLILENNWHQVLVFVRTKRGANKVAYDLQKSKIEAAAIHGDKSQGQRTRALAGFKSGSVDVLVATDIAARGLDIEQLPQVINFDLPNIPEDYVHRIGRTGRAGAEGCAISLVCADEVDCLRSIENLIKNKLPRKQIDGFEPDHTVPETQLSAAKKKKPHKKKLAKANDKSPRAQKSGAGKSESRKSGTRKPNPRKSSTKKNSQSRKTSAESGGKNR